MIDIRRRTTYFFLLVSLGHVLLISAQVQSKSGIPVLEHVAFGAFAGAQRAAAAVTDSVWSVFAHYVALRGVASENASLRAQIAELQGQVQQKDALAAQASGLEAALKLQTSVPQRTLPARVIAGDPVPGAETVTIDRGSDDGVREYMGVIAAGGVVGRIMTGVMPHAARVQLLTGRNAGAGALLERVNAEGAVTGGGDLAPLRMLYIPNSYEVKAGDRVVTSGHDRVFPPGFVIGWVDQAERGNTTYRLIAVRPAANFGHLDYLLVLIDPPAGAQIPGGGE